MATRPYKQISWTGEAIAQGKLQAMADNEQWLYENTPRLRYTNNGMVRDAGMKLLAGKTYYGASSIQHVYVDVFFGSFFSSGVQPIITALVETQGHGRKDVSIAGFGGQVDSRGFRAAVYTDELTYIDAGGWLHWMAVGY